MGGKELKSFFQKEKRTGGKELKSFFQKEKRMGGKECKQKIGPASDWFNDSKGSHGRRLNLSLRPADSYSYSVSSSASSSSSPPWLPYWSPTTTSQTGIPFSWEEKPGVPKNRKSPTRDGCFGQHPQSISSEFSAAEEFDQMERRPRRRPKKRVDEVDEFVSSFVECTKKPVAAVSMSKDVRQRRGKEGFGSTFSCITSCTINADALVTIPGRARQLSRQNNKEKEWKNQKSYQSYKYDKD